ncbi:EF-hand calcium-binding domain-containing protein 4A [Platysternon megacephalum]|uniref:Myelin and lymphocyte protein n=1 Tax=Platysternon megacephalum TaxID=55544 RepID=A0A4D9E6H8_9SAUR|nr:EF-hand calcium-binding domain-containing protein 4A [Platysternon megacephalum]
MSAQHNPRALGDTQVFGGLVWILVASTRVYDQLLQGWVMFVSVFCFTLSTLLMCLYFCGAHGGKSSWIAVVFGGLVWILVASTRVYDQLLQGWVMFVSVFCFTLSTLLMCLYFCGAHGGKSSWIAVDAFYHSMAALFYLSAAVLQAYATIVAREVSIISSAYFKIYQEDIAAVVSVK